jgi:hypothetical protein
MAEDRKDREKNESVLDKVINREIFRRDIDFGEGNRRNVNDIVDTLSPPPRRDRDGGGRDGGDQS